MVLDILPGQTILAKLKAMEKAKAYIIELELE
jgi:hypothetical protein